MKYFRILIVLMITIFVQAKSFEFSEKYTLVENDSLSPVMEYVFSAENVKGLNDSALSMFTKPHNYAQDRFKYLCKDYDSIIDIYHDFPGTPSLNYQYIEKAEVLFKNRKYISLRFLSYMYTGGAHGNTTIKQWIIDRKSRDVLPFENVFVENCEQDLKSLNDRYLQDLFPNNSIDEILFDKDYQVSRDIYLNRKGIVFQYDPYDIAPYSTGPIEILVPYKELSPFLKIKL